MDELISIAHIARPHGVRGEVSAEILTDFPERFEEMEEVTLARNQVVAGSFEIESIRFHKQRLLIKFSGIDDADAAATLKGLSLVVSRDELVELEQDEFYTFDLEGCDVVTEDGSPVGRVIRVDDFGAAPLLVVAGNGREFLIPLASEFCPEVDTGAKRIVVRPAEGLLDL